MDLEKLRWAALMHDIGKIGIPATNSTTRQADARGGGDVSHPPAKGKRILEPIPFMEELIPAPSAITKPGTAAAIPRA